MKKLIILACGLCLTMVAHAQTTVEAVLSAVGKNNKTIAASQQYWEAQKLEYSTGLNPDNPQINYDFMIGSPSTAGNQTDLTVTQSFDFPTAYIKKKQLAKEQAAQAEFQLLAIRRDILLEAKETCIELIYHNKRNLELSKRKSNTQKLLEAYQTQMDKGEGSILNVNKAKLMMIDIEKQYSANLSAINQLHQKLAELNGGAAISLTDTAYPFSSVIPDFETLEKEYEANDPVRQLLEQEKAITQKQIEVSKTGSLPKFEAGYHYQGILGQTFQGVHAGVTIPLWENKNRVKTQQANYLYTDLELQTHINEHYHEIKRIYEKYENLNATLGQYQSVLQTFNSTELLDKALSLGHLSNIEYFLELSYYYSAYDTYLETEKEYQAVLAELLKYKL